ncbi:hypothetical protein Cadr_000028405 [Camelus dromedarius]|uniref:Uncharacterized protein n=1 Tax=Camelus dromedarius TaxID=9838 RepID=A0A5N4CHC8_CAMDR|nr:hypothetical protein Cadr_000028405 [Camelus dromedarius]
MGEHLGLSAPSAPPRLTRARQWTLDTRLLSDGRATSTCDPLWRIPSCPGVLWGGLLLRPQNKNMGPFSMASSAAPPGCCQERMAETLREATRHSRLIVLLVSLMGWGLQTEDGGWVPAAAGPPCARPTQQLQPVLSHCCVCCGDSDIHYGFRHLNLDLHRGMQRCKDYRETQLDQKPPGCLTPDIEPTVNPERRRNRRRRHLHGPVSAVPHQRSPHRCNTRSLRAQLSVVSARLSVPRGLGNRFCSFDISQGRPVGSPRDHPHLARGRQVMEALVLLCLLTSSSEGEVLFTGTAGLTPPHLPTASAASDSPVSHFLAADTGNPLTAAPALRPRRQPNRILRREACRELARVTGLSAPSGPEQSQHCGGSRHCWALSSPLYDTGESQWPCPGHGRFLPRAMLLTCTQYLLPCVPSTEGKKLKPGRGLVLFPHPPSWLGGTLEPPGPLKTTRWLGSADVRLTDATAPFPAPTWEMGGSVPTFSRCLLHASRMPASTNSARAPHSPAWRPPGGSERPQCSSFGEPSSAFGIRGGMWGSRPPSVHWQVTAGGDHRGVWSVQPCIPVIKEPAERRSQVGTRAWVSLFISELNHWYDLDTPFPRMKHCEGEMKVAVLAALLLRGERKPRPAQLQNPKHLVPLLCLVAPSLRQHCPNVLQGEELPQGQGGTKPQFQAYAKSRSPERLGSPFLWPVLCSVPPGDLRGSVPGGPVAFVGSAIRSIIKGFMLARWSCKEADRQEQPPHPSHPAALQEQEAACPLQLSLTCLRDVSVLP